MHMWSSHLHRTSSFGKLVPSIIPHDHRTNMKLASIYDIAIMASGVASVAAEGPNRFAPDTSVLRNDDSVRFPH